MTTKLSFETRCLIEQGAHSLPIARQCLHSTHTFAFAQRHGRAGAVRVNRPQHIVELMSSPCLTLLLRMVPDRRGMALYVQVKKLVEGAYQRASSILRGHEAELHTLAGALLDKETLSGTQAGAPPAPAFPYCRPPRMVLIPGFSICPCVERGQRHLLHMALTQAPQLAKKTCSGQPGRPVTWFAGALPGTADPLVCRAQSSCLPRFNSGSSLCTWRSLADVNRA